jgi:hypothetical protein
LPNIAKPSARGPKRKSYDAPMRYHVRAPRPQRTSRGAQRAPRPTAAPRHTSRTALPTLSREISVEARPSIRRDIALAPRVELPEIDTGPDPYVDYGRSLTAEGSIIICYKGIDERWRHTIWRLLAWSAATFVDGHFVFQLANIQHKALSLFCLLVAAIINWLIVRKPVEICRQVEIKPDCMVIDGTDIFWLRKMEAGWPAFRPDDTGKAMILCGTYGTRFVEYLKVPRFEDEDRAPEVFAAHLQDAINQLWMKPMMMAP